MRYDEHRLSLAGLLECEAVMELCDLVQPDYGQTISPDHKQVPSMVTQCLHLG